MWAETYYVEIVLKMLSLYLIYLVNLFIESLIKVTDPEGIRFLTGDFVGDRNKPTEITKRMKTHLPLVPHIYVSELGQHWLI